jgi:hypothetical protein
MQMCRTELILVGLTQIRCLSGVLGVDRWRQDQTVEQGRRIPPTPAQRLLPKSARTPECVELNSEFTGEMQLSRDFSNAVELIVFSFMRNVYKTNTH